MVCATYRVSSFHKSSTATQDNISSSNFNRTTIIKVIWE
jgi:hypothetical protein